MNKPGSKIYYPGWKYTSCFIFRGRIKLWLVLILFLGTKLSAQTMVLDYGRQIIDTLTSSAMNGRGYVDSADWKAANFIEGEMRRSGLQPFGKDFFQPYSLDANVFPGKMELRINKKKLNPGSDFLIDAASASCHGKFKMALVRKSADDTAMSAIAPLIASATALKKKKTAIAFQKNDFTKKQYQQWKTAAIETVAFGHGVCVEFTNDKLTWDASTEEVPLCYFQVKGNVPSQKKSKVAVDAESHLKKNYTARNVAGYVKGTMYPDSFIVFSAHYDHLGQMGNGTYFPGANDNASGSSMVLNLAAYFSAHPSKYSIAFLSFSGEELGLLGSSYYVEHPLFPLDNIMIVVNLDIVGTGDEGIKVVNATEFPADFDRLVKLNEKEQLLKVVSPRGKAANSDHYPFYEKGVPSFFIYTMGGIAAYHDIYDRSETLPLTAYENVFKLLVDFVNTF
jgi:aminopeptidase YwaD